MAIDFLNKERENSLSHAKNRFNFSKEGDIYGERTEHDEVANEVSIEATLNSLGSPNHNETPARSPNHLESFSSLLLTLKKLFQWTSGPTPFLLFQE